MAESFEPTTFSMTCNAANHYTTGARWNWSEKICIWSLILCSREGPGGVRILMICECMYVCVWERVCVCESKIVDRKTSYSTQSAICTREGCPFGWVCSINCLGPAFLAVREGSRERAATSKGHTPSLCSWATLFCCSRLPWAFPCSKKQALNNWGSILPNGDPSLKHITDWVL